MASFTPRPLYFRGKSPRYCYRGLFVSPKASLFTIKEGNISYPFRELNPDSSGVQPVIYLLYLQTVLSPVLIFRFLDKKRLKWIAASNCLT
jgi:hypothetical protein